MITIAITYHGIGRAFRTVRQRMISMEQALNIHDPFVNH